MSDIWLIPILFAAVVVPILCWVWGFVTGEKYERSRPPTALEDR